MLGSNLILSHPCTCEGIESTRELQAGSVSTQDVNQVYHIRHSKAEPTGKLVMIPSALSKMSLDTSPRILPSPGQLSMFTTNDEDLESVSIL